ncbi:MAG TPA: AMP-binding protein [Acidimicrobiales bacterium]
MPRVWTIHVFLADGSRPFHYNLTVHRSPTTISQMATTMPENGARTLVELFKQAKPDNLGTPLLTLEDGSVLTYRDADKRSAQLAHLLLAEGVQIGDRVAVQIEKSPTAIWTYLACLRAGAVLLPMNPAYTPDEVAYLLGDATPKVVIADPGSPAAALSSNAFTCAADESGSLADSIATLSPEFDDRPVGPDDPAILPYTSGTTGRPKGAPLSQHNLSSNAEALIATWGFTDEDILIHILPLFHVHGLVVGLNCVFGAGAQMRFYSRFVPQDVIDAFADSTVMMGVPTHYHRLLAEERLNEASCAPMRLFISGSAPLLAPVFNEFSRRTGKPILERYGMTETAMICSNPLDGERRAGTVGFPLPGVEVRVADETTDKPIETGKIGAIQVRGPNVFSGYLGRPELNATEFCPDGFFRTGDLGAFSDDGYLSILGRSKDLVISGGLNVYPKEVEDVLDNLPGVEESAVIGIADPDFGEAVVAAVVPEPDAALDPATLRAEARERLAPYKVPKHVVIVDALPRNTMGKVEKSRLRDQLAVLLVQPEDK